jgi:hypothetical protein
MVVRVVMALFGVLYGSWGVWAIGFPRHFFDTFPGLGYHWTAAYPPYNHHLVTDLGATFLTLAFVLIAGAVVRHRSARVLALAAAGFFGALHLGFHSLHAGEMGSRDYTLSLISLVGGVAVPAGLLVWDHLLARRTKMAP